MKKIIINSIKIILFLICLLLFICNVMVRQIGYQAIKNLKYQLYMVSDNTLKPEYNVYDLAIVEYVNVNKIDVDDVIAVLNDNNLNDAKIRKLESIEKIDTNTYYRVNDYKNAENDDIIISKININGRVVMVIPFIGFIAYFINSDIYSLLFAISLLLYITHKIYKKVTSEPLKKDKIMQAKIKGNAIIFEDLKLVRDESTISVVGNVVNYSNLEIKFLKVRVSFLSEQDYVLNSKIVYVCGKEGIQANEIKKLISTIENDRLITKFRVETISFKE